MNTRIFGLIGYSILSDTNKLVLVMADKHDSLPPCNYDYHNISSWLETKFNKSDILLEEVERNNNKLQELWSSSQHTQDLKHLYLNNVKIIIPIDIRNNYIPFSWETFNINENDIFLYQYLIPINTFFCIQDHKLATKFKYYNITILKNTPLGNYFLLLKKEYAKFINKYIAYLYHRISEIIDKQHNILEDFNTILHSILEWYTIARIIYSNNQTIIVHTGLAHSEKIIYYLQKMFEFHVIDSQGINKIEQLNNNITSCFLLPSDINYQFGGYHNNYI